MSWLAAGSAFAFIVEIPDGDDTRRPGRRALRQIPSARAVTNLEFLFLGVFLAKLFHEGVDELLVGLVPVGDDVELLAVPLDDAGPVIAQVIRAAGFHRTNQLSET